MPKIEIDGLVFNYRENTRDLIILDQVVSNNGYHLPDDMSGQFVLDVGGHLGSVALMAAKRGADVWTLEPTNDTYCLLVDNIIENKLEDKVMPLRWAVGEFGRRKLYHYKDAESEANSLFQDHGELTDEYETVLVRPLSHIMSEIKDDIDLLKLDCEGAEREIIPEIISLHNRIRIIIVEFHQSKQEVDGYIKLLSEHYVVLPLSHIEYAFIHKGEV